MKSSLLPNSGSYRIFGIDVGSTIIGVGEYSFEYQITPEGGYSSQARIEDYYSLRLDQKKDFNEKILFVHRYFTGLDESLKIQRIAYIEDVPFVRNVRVHSVLKEFTAAIRIPLLLKGWAVHDVNVGTWKKQVVGSGNATKPQIRVWATGGGLPLDASSLEEDSLDALCIGVYGLQKLTAQIGLFAKNKIELLGVLAE